MATESNSDIAAEHNIIHRRGDTFERIMRYWSDAARTVPVDITGSTFKINVVEENADFPFIILSFEIGSGLAITAPNILTMSKTATEMKVTPGIYYYDIQKTTGSTVVTIQFGTFTVNREETQ